MKALTLSLILIAIMVCGCKSTDEIRGYCAAQTARCIEVGGTGRWAWGRRSKWSDWQIYCETPEGGRREVFPPPLNQRRWLFGCDRYEVTP